MTPSLRDADRWRTFPAERTVIAIARTVTSTVRALDALVPALRDDPRVDVLFAYDPTSAFGAGVPELLRTAGVGVLTWDQLRETPCDLIVTATENADLAGIGGRAPVLVLPHGVGFHKHVPDSRSPADRVSGVVPEDLLLSGRAWLALSHPDQAAQLAALHPATVGRTLLVGDPSYDRLLAGRDLRASYRAALGVGPGQRLVTVTSTWRTQSLLGADPGLPARLLAELPLDEHRVALITHPNIAAWHSPWRLRSALAAAREAGLLLVPPTPADGWQSALLAADLVMGDHGSVTFYAAALGLPVLLAAFGTETVPDTPAAELGRVAPRWDPAAPAAPQLAGALAEHDRERLVKTGAAALAAPGEAVPNLRAALYRLLGLPPRAPAHAFGAGGAQAPEPFVPEETAVTSTVIATTVSGEGEARTVDVRRHPAAVGPELPDEHPHSRHLACAENERDPALRQSASTLLRDGPASHPAAAASWARDILTRYPGALLAAAALPGNACLVRLRDGRTLTTTATGPPLPPALHAATVYAQLRAGQNLTGLLTLRAGGRAVDVALTSYGGG